MAYQPSEQPNALSWHNTPKLVCTDAPQTQLLFNLIGGVRNHRTPVVICSWEVLNKLGWPRHPQTLQEIHRRCSIAALPPVVRQVILLLDPTNQLLHNPIALPAVPAWPQAALEQVAQGTVCLDDLLPIDPTLEVT